MEDNMIGSALTQDETTRYNPQTNRCYVKLEVHTADLSTPQDHFYRSRYLYDGQTKELLATTTWRGKDKTAMIFKESLQRLVHNQFVPSYDETAEMIERFVTEDRRP